MSSDEIKPMDLIWEPICTTTFWNETQWFSELTSSQDFMIGSMKKEQSTNLASRTETLYSNFQRQDWRGPKFCLPKNMPFGILIWGWLVGTKDSERTFDPLPLYLPWGSQLTGRGHHLSILLSTKRGRQKASKACLLNLPVYHCFGGARQEFVYHMFILSHLPVNCFLSLWNPRPLPPILPGPKWHMNLNCPMHLIFLRHPLMYNCNKFWTSSPIKNEIKKINKNTMWSFCQLFNK